MARLDRVAAVKRIAQVGAVIGREFGYELLAEIEMMSEAALADVLARLVASELASCRGEIPESVYTFKHALVQDTAYDLLLKSQRMTIHGKIAQALEKRWPESRDTKPELLAHHYTAAGLFEAATPYWRRAGELAMQRFALREAITHLNNGMMLIEKLPSGPRRDLMELELRTVLGPAVVAQHGWAQGEVSRILEPGVDCWSNRLVTGRPTSRSSTRCGCITCAWISLPCHSRRPKSSLPPAPLHATTASRPWATGRRRVALLVGRSHRCAPQEMLFVRCTILGAIGISRSSPTPTH